VRHWLRKIKDLFRKRGKEKKARSSGNAVDMADLITHLFFLPFLLPAINGIFPPQSLTFLPRIAFALEAPHSVFPLISSDTPHASILTPF
jgi:hypothetical protein